MKAVLYCPAAAPSSSMRRVEERPAVRSPRVVEDPLLSEICPLGGEERMRGAAAEFEMFQAALTELVRNKPRAYGAGDDPKSQSRVVAQLFESVSASFLERTVSDLRHEAGYVLVFGYWIHRAV